MANSQLGFIKRKSYLTNLGAFYKEKAGLVHNWRTVDFVYFNFSKAFDTISHNIPIHKLMKYKLDKRGLKTGQIARVKDLWMMGQSAPSNQFAGSTKLGVVVDQPEHCAAIQRDLNRLKKWATSNLIKFNKGKCKVLHLGRNNLRHLYTPSANWLENSFTEKDLWVLMVDILNMSQ